MEQGGRGGPYRNSLFRRFPTGVAGKGNQPGNQGFSLDVLGENLDQKYLCRICGFVLKHPVQGDCGHRFCRECIPSMGGVEDEEPVLCPACETEGDETSLSPDDIYPDKAIQRDMKELDAICINEGCTWSGDFSNYVTHEMTCERRMMTCECGETVVALHVTRHVTAECPLREVSCVFCHQKIQARDIGEHNTECNLYPVECPECNIKVPRVNLEVHLDPLRGDCRNSKCRYGCDALNTREHEQECMALHLRITFNRLLELEERFQERDDNTVRKEAAEDTTLMGSSVTTSLSATAKPFVPAPSPIPVVKTTVAVDEHRVRGFAGVLEWTIKDFNRKRQEAIDRTTRVLYSPVFYKGRNGYRLCACVYLDGDGMSKGSHMSFFFTIFQGEHDAELPWPFNNKITLMLLDQSGAEDHIIYSFLPDPTSESFQKPRTDRNTPSGCPLFCPVEKLIGDDSPYVKDDAIRLKVIVD